MEFKIGDKLRYNIDKFVSNCYSMYFHNRYLEEDKIYIVISVMDNYIELAGLKFLVFDKRCFEKILWIEEYKDGV